MRVSCVKMMVTR